MKQTIANSLLKDSIKQSSYKRDTLKSRIVHLGFGAFHRAHQALITDETLAKSDSDWGICEINLFGGEQLIKDLREQEHMYTVVEKGAEGSVAKIIRSVRESIHPELDGKEAALEKMAESQVAIVSMTITEKGYCIEPGSGKLDVENTLIAADLKNPQQPVSAIGYIVEALRIRRDRGITAFSVMSCDNIPENGHVARSAVLDFAKALDTELAQWIEENVTFPSTMVDRIVPALTPETQVEINEVLGVEDTCGIACEPFRQWVVEDNFVAGRPEWELAGAELVADVIPYEEMKLRMLNGSHSFLAYLGYLGGYDHISDTMTDDNYRHAAHNMMLQDQLPTLNMPAGVDAKHYAGMLIERFINPSIKHRTWQIAMDGSQKLPQRMLDSIRFHLEKGTEFHHLALGVAGWMRYVSGVNEQGEAIDVRDPMAEKLRAICDEHGLNVTVVPALLAVDAIFAPELAANERFVEAVTAAYQNLLDNGARKAVASLV